MIFKKITLLGVMAVLCLFFKANAQNQNNTIKPLKVGDKLPESFWTRPIPVVQKEQAKIIKLEAYRNKLLILDFWSSYCIPCLEAFPKISALNQNYASKVEILSVGKEETLAGLKKITARLEVGKLALTQVLRNHYIDSLFPYTILPHLVWIYKNEVIAITNGEQLNSTSIDSILTSKGSVAMQWYKKVDWLYKGSLSLVKFGTSEVPAPKTLFTSSFSSFIEGVSPPAGRKVDSIAAVARLNIYNQPILAFCWLAFNGTMSQDTSAVEFRIVDRTRFIRPKPTPLEWHRQNAYCYELILPLAYSQKEAEQMLQSEVANWLSVLGIQVIPIRDNTKKKFANQKQKHES